MIHRIVMENVVGLHMFAQLGRTNRSVSRQSRGIEGMFQSLRPATKCILGTKMCIFLTVLHGKDGLIVSSLLCVILFNCKNLELLSNMLHQLYSNRRCQHQYSSSRCEPGKDWAVKFCSSVRCTSRVGQ